MAGMMGMQDMNSEDMSGKLEDMMSTIRQVNEQFKNPVRTSFLFSLDLFIFSVVPRSLDTRDFTIGVP